MASYTKKEGRNQDTYHVWGEDEDLDFAGEEAWKLNYKQSRFSWKRLEIDGEKEGVDYFKVKGIDRKNYKVKEKY